MTITHRIIAICGGSGSGKTTLARHLQNRIGAQNCHLISQDDYYHDIRTIEYEGELPDFDHPDALDFDEARHNLADLKSGETVTPPSYDFATHFRVPSNVKLEPRPVIIFEGILVLTDAAPRELYDLSLYLKCPEELRFSRRRSRDIEERGRTPESVDYQLTHHVIPSHDRFVLPSSQMADIIVEQDDYLADIDAICESMIAKLREA